MSLHDDRRNDVMRLIREHLTAAMIMVPLDEPRDPDARVSETRHYLDEHGFDLALVASGETMLVMRDVLRGLPASKGDEKIRRYARSPRRDRLIGRDLELMEVANRLNAEPTPLLVVGRDGPQHIITRADFTRPAGQAAVLSVLVTLDAELDEALRPVEDSAWAALEEKRRKDIEQSMERARDRDQEVPRLSYLLFRDRLEVSRRIGLAERLSLDLGSQRDHDLLTSVRNDLAHGRTPEGCSAIEALIIGLRILQDIAASVPAVV